MRISINNGLINQWTKNVEGTWQKVKRQNLLNDGLDKGDDLNLSGPRKTPNEPPASCSAP